MSATSMSAPDPVATSAVRRSAGGILIVDDTPSALQLMAQLLHREGYVVRPALSGEVALRAAFLQPPDLVLLDVRMPKMDGYEVCRRLKADARTEDVPVIFLSALTDSDSRVRGFEVGGSDFISKPIQAEEVLARVHTHLTLGRALRAMDQMNADLRETVLQERLDQADLSDALDRQVSEHRSTARKLQLASEAIAAAEEAIIVADSTGAVVSANPACLALTGFTLEQLQDMRAAGLFEAGQEDVDAVRGLLAGQRPAKWTGEMWIRRQSGDPLPVWISLASFAEEHSAVTNFVLVFSDLSQRKESEARIRYLAEHDLLTGLPTRVLLQDRFDVARSGAISGHERLAMMFIDIDRFETVNASLGHPVGDEYLRKVAAAVGEVLPGSEGLARIGGDAFLALVGGLDSSSEAGALAQRIRHRLDAEFDVNGHTVRRTASIGISICPDDGEAFEDLARRADTAMHLAKAAGGNSVVFHTETMNVELQNQIALEVALRAGLEGNEFFLRYQPQVDLGTGRIVGVEALVRWARPGVGEVEPSAFIPVAESSGLIVGLGAQVMSMACEQARQWLDAGIAVPIAVNVSSVEIWHGGLEARIERLLASNGVPGAMLEVEITESGLIDDTDTARAFVARMLEIGVRLSIDDFLTGYSNFLYLRQFRPSHLKIDKTFINSMSAGSEDHVIVRAAIQMANVLGIPTIAEGVETLEQAELLRAAGCSVGQGFLFARPLTADEAGVLLARGSCGPEGHSRID